MDTITLIDAGEPFEVCVHRAAQPSCIVLFAVGRGGNPARHKQLLNSLAANGCTVVAPHSAFLHAFMPTPQDLAPRARRLRLALDAVAAPGSLVAGVGHSIGATMLLGLAGAQVWSHARERVEIVGDARIARLALLAPALDFFYPPDALATVSVPIAAWAGTRDEYTPPSQLECLKSAPATVELHSCEGAGHFSFMDVLPPNVVDPLPNRAAFLEEIASTVARFVTG